jgi:hypothetical protein
VQQAPGFRAGAFCLGLICSNSPGPSVPEWSFDDSAGIQEPIECVYRLHACITQATLIHFNLRTFRSLPKIDVESSGAGLTLGLGGDDSSALKRCATQLRPGTAAAGSHSSG